MGKTIVRFVMMVLVVFFAPTVLGDIIHVDADATGTNDGGSWENAFVYLQDALAAAVDSDEIRVAQGVYKPDLGAGITAGDRDATFQIINGVSVKGGYAGFGEVDPDAKDVVTNKTILSGDLIDNDAEVADPFDLCNEPTRSDNSRHLLTGSGTDSSAILDGFTITGGNAHEPGGAEWEDPRGWGGGMVNFSGSPTVTNCTFQANSADWWSGAMLNEHNSSPRIANCKFIGNGVRYIYEEYNANAGGIGNAYDSNPTIENCVFIGNKATQAGAMFNYESNPIVKNCEFISNHARWGGALFNSFSNPKFSNCIFQENKAIVNGGAIYHWTGSPTLEKCLFINNVAEQNVGGGIQNYLNSNPILTNCTFVGNTAGNTGGGVNNSSGCSSTLLNCILWGNTPSQISGSAQVTYSDIEGGYYGTGNINVAPLFVRRANGDYHLRSLAGAWDESTQSWVPSDQTSPCIDAGSIASPIGLEPFPNGGVVNMGAYGGTAEASKSYFGGLVCETIVAGDINGDCVVNLADLAIMASHWLEDNRKFSPFRYGDNEYSSKPYGGFVPMDG